MLKTKQTNTKTPQIWLGNFGVFNEIKTFCRSGFSTFCIASLNNTLHLPLRSECLLGAVVQVSPLNFMTLLVRHRLSPSSPKAGPACPTALQKNIKLFLPASTELVNGKH